MPILKQKEKSSNLETNREYFLDWVSDLSIHKMTLKWDKQQQSIYRFETWLSHFSFGFYVTKWIAAEPNSF